MFLGIEIGGTKLQMGLGEADGELHALWRGTVVPEAGGLGIRQQIASTIPKFLAEHGLKLKQIERIGIGFGGPTNDSDMSVITSHHIEGWDNFPLGSWLEAVTQRPVVICNDADVAGLAEARFGAGKGMSPIFYITVGSGIGGGLIIDERIYRGVGQGAGEVGHVRPVFPLLEEPHDHILESFASGWSIGARAQTTCIEVAQAAEQGDPLALQLINEAMQALGEGICTVIKLLCPARVIIGGGVSLIGEKLFFEPLRRYVSERGFEAFAGLTEIVPAQLGEEVVVHGAIALAEQA